jgi:hypothetical protein
VSTMAAASRRRGRRDACSWGKAISTTARGYRAAQRARPSEVAGIRHLPDR